jgi:hypothetical protein
MKMRTWLLTIGLAWVPLVPAWGAGPRTVTVVQGAVLCANHGDIVVYANSGVMMPSCNRLAHDTRAIQIGVDNGVVGVRDGDSATFYTLAVSVSRSVEAASPPDLRCDGDASILARMACGAGHSEVVTPERPITAVPVGSLPLPRLTKEQTCPWMDPRIRGECLEAEQTAKFFVEDLWPKVVGPAYVHPGPTDGGRPMSTQEYCSMLGANAPRGYERMASCLTQFYEAARPH